MIALECIIFFVVIPALIAGVILISTKTKGDQ
jgi:hypothetical protein